MKSFKNVIMLLILCFSIVFVSTSIAEAQAVAPTGVTQRASSQQVFWYDEDSTAGPSVRMTGIQLTNTNNTSGVWVHVQIYRSNGPLNSDRCLEVDFVDFYTANDTHVYFTGTGGCFENRSADPVNAPIPCQTAQDTKGFIIVTPIADEFDNRPIAWQHLIGDTVVADSDGTVFRVNSMGRDAQNPDGSLVADGTILDGTATAFTLLQPDEIFFNFTFTDQLNGNTSDIVAMSFADTYDPNPTLGYRAVGATTALSPFIHDAVETRFSCTPVTSFCFDDWNLSNLISDPGNLLVSLGAGICDGININDDINGLVSGWGRFLTAGITGSNNFLGLVAFEDFGVAGEDGGADWMSVAGFRTTPPPPNECPLNPDGSPSDCSLAACKPLDGCENPNQTNDDGVNFCQDGVDNDGVNGTDCQDFGCDGFTAITSEEGEVTGPCESAGETTCDDGFDNDANGFIDCGLLGGDPDPTCVANGECGNDDDDNTGSGGCSVAASATAGTAAASFLLPLLPLAGAYALRSIRRRKK